MPDNIRPSLMALMKRVADRYLKRLGGGGGGKKLAATAQRVKYHLIFNHIFICNLLAAAASQIRLSVVVFFPGRSDGRHFKKLQHL